MIFEYHFCSRFCLLSSSFYQISVTGALGVRLKTAREERENERRILNEARGKFSKILLETLLSSCSTYRTQTIGCQAKWWNMGKLNCLPITWKHRNIIVISVNFSVENINLPLDFRLLSWNCKITFKSKLKENIFFNNSTQQNKIKSDFKIVVVVV